VVCDTLVYFVITSVVTVQMQAVGGKCTWSTLHCFMLPWALYIFLLPLPSPLQSGDTMCNKVAKKWDGWTTIRKSSLQDDVACQS